MGQNWHEICKVSSACKGGGVGDSRGAGSLSVKRKCPLEEYLVSHILSRKPGTSLGNPWPDSVLLPFLSQQDDCADYESELCVVIGKSCKNVSEGDALDYVLGYTASNDISSRASQFAQSQWCFSKGFDGSCPIGMLASRWKAQTSKGTADRLVGPTIVSPHLIPNPAALHIRGLKNGKQLQNCSLEWVRAEWLCEYCLIKVAVTLYFLSPA